MPSEQLETVNVKLVPEDPLMEKVHPVAVPEFEKSEFDKPVTWALKVIEKEKLELELVGVA